MTEEEFDTAFGERLRSYAARRRAPADLEDRLVRSIRGRARRMRLGVLGLVVLVLATVFAVFGVSNVPEKTPRGAPTLVATDHPRDDSTVTGWMFLGCLRECFRRNRTARRRDEDVETDERKSAAPTP